MKKTREPKFYKIDKGLKVPAIAVNREPTTPSRTSLTMQVLEKGDSFLIKDEVTALKSLKVVRDFVSRDRKRDVNRVFTTRKVGNGLRIWRVK